MKVKYEIFDKDGYHSVCAVMKDLFPNDELPTIKNFVTTGTGEIVGFIKGGLFSKDKFLIVDDESKEFIKVNIEDCKIVK